MATGSAAGDEPDGAGRFGLARNTGQSVLSALVSAPGRSTATLLVILPYCWLGYYVVGTALGRHGDVIVSGDWLTLLFTTYAFLSSIALAHRILRIGLEGATVESILDVVVLVWLTVFYFVWMLARDPVSPSTTVSELYAPVLAGEPAGILWAGVAGASAILVAWIVAVPRPETRPFRTRFRTALVTLPAVLTATVLIVRPGSTSLLWPVIGGIFLGTFLGGATRIHVIATAIARGAFAGLSLLVWSVGAAGWLLVYRQRPPTDAVMLGQVGRSVDRDRTTESGVEKGK